MFAWKRSASAHRESECWNREEAEQRRKFVRERTTNTFEQSSTSTSTHRRKATSQSQPFLFRVFLSFYNILPPFSEIFPSDAQRHRLSEQRNFQESATRSSSPLPSCFLAVCTGINQPGPSPPSSVGYQGKKKKKTQAATTTTTTTTSAPSHQRLLRASFGLFCDRAGTALASATATPTPSRSSSRSIDVQ